MHAKGHRPAPGPLQALSTAGCGGPAPLQLLQACIVRGGEAKLSAFSTLALSGFLNRLHIYSLNKHLLMLTPARAVQLSSHCPDCSPKPQHSLWLLTQARPSGLLGSYNSREEGSFPGLWESGVQEVGEVMPVLRCDWWQQLATRRGGWGRAFQAEGTAGTKKGSVDFLQRAGPGGCDVGEAVGTKAGKALPAGVLLAMRVQCLLCAELRPGFRARGESTNYGLCLPQFPHMLEELRGPAPGNCRESFWWGWGGGETGRRKETAWKGCARGWRSNRGSSFKSGQWELGLDRFSGPRIRWPCWETRSFGSQAVGGGLWSNVCPEWCSGG